MDGIASRMEDVADCPLLILTIGHSTRPIEEFIGMLNVHEVKRLVDIRTVPRSRANPQFEGTSLAASLQPAGIYYMHLKALGGLRRPRADSPNSGWRNTSFRGYADYMQTPDFEEALNRLIEMAKEERTAIMCAEAVPWRCHRSLVADALLARGIRVEDIMSETRRVPHRLTRFARVNGLHITYPPEEFSSLPGRSEP